MSRYELQWAVVLNCSVIALFAGVHAVDPEGSVFWGLLFVALMIGQIVQATRPERPAKATRPEPDEASQNSE
ncbi:MULTISPECIES: hypothetical protein [unclassified Frigoribacterium]|uniref:hypothetical protein n=1 Tax=unclassified Frigoribacterium TaxID=2627005 RepID=UPI001564FC95|nr:MULTISPECIES: hypothetical protein [unclassified Frigoribacterium]NQW87499.1 hypothetical protein [Frigoribacterium sp. VKM Ac-2860]NQX09692.1 hypothetical protein [Frigoribacterium sp. VKM Ac-2859]